MRSALHSLVVCWHGLLTCEDGQDAVEYVLLTALISVSVVIASESVATALAEFFVNAAAVVS